MTPDSSCSVGDSCIPRTAARGSRVGHAEHHSFPGNPGCFHMTVRDWQHCDTVPCPVLDIRRVQTVAIRTSICLLIACQWNSSCDNVRHRQGVEYLPSNHYRSPSGDEKLLAEIQSQRGPLQGLGIPLNILATSRDGIVRRLYDIYVQDYSVYRHAVHCSNWDLQCWEACNPERRANNHAM